MSELDEVTRKYPSHASSADDSYPHVQFPFSNPIVSYASLRLVIVLSRPDTKL